MTLTSPATDFTTPAMMPYTLCKLCLPSVFVRLLCANRLNFKACGTVRSRLDSLQPWKMPNREQMTRPQAGAITRVRVMAEHQSPSPSIRPGLRLRTHHRGCLPVAPLAARFEAGVEEGEVCRAPCTVPEVKMIATTTDLYRGVAVPTEVRMEVFEVILEAVMTERPLEAMDADVAVEPPTRQLETTRRAIRYAPSTSTRNHITKRCR